MSNTGLLVLALLISIFSAALCTINMVYFDTRHLPVVHLDKNGDCIKVDNYENGHAFNCQDVNVLLRRYRVEVKAE